MFILYTSTNEVKETNLQNMFPSQKPNIRYQQNFPCLSETTPRFDQILERRLWKGIAEENVQIHNDIEDIQRRVM